MKCEVFESGSDKVAELELWGGAAFSVFQGYQCFQESCHFQPHCSRSRFARNHRLFGYRAGKNMHHHEKKNGRFEMMITIILVLQL